CLFVLFSCRLPSVSSLYVSPSRLPPSSPLFPYTTLFRSRCVLSRPGRPARAGRSALGGHAGALDRALRLRSAHLGCRYPALPDQDRKSTRLNSSHVSISYAVFCLKKKR